MIISISGTPGAGKTTIAQELAKKLGYTHYSIGSIMDKIAKEKKLYIEDLAKLREKDNSIDKKLDDYQIAIGKKEDNFVIDSRLGFYFIPSSFKIFLYCNLDVAAERIFKNQRASEKNYATKNELKKALRKRATQDKKMYKKLYGIANFYDKKHFDVCIDTSDLTVQEIINRIMKNLEKLAIEMKQPIYEIWGPELFDKIWSSTSFNSEQTRLICEALKPAFIILDLGTGIGNVAKKLVEQGKIVWGVDINQKNLDYTSKKINSKKFHLILKDAQKLDYHEKFDGASCASNLAYFDDLNKIMGVVYRSLKFGGLFAITGYEFNKMKEWAILTGEESRKAIESGEIKLTDKELQKLQKATEDSLETTDSFKMARADIRKAGFTILDHRRFYHNTAYFILAKKD